MKRSEKRAAKRADSTSEPGTPAEVERSALREQLVELILDGDLQLDGREVASMGGVGYEDARRLWRALGFPDSSGSAVYSEADVRALALVRDSMAAGLLDEDTIFRLARALGRTMSRLADWQVEAMVEQVERDVLEGRANTRLERAVQIAGRAAPNMEQLMVYTWRRHLAAAAARLEALGAEEDELLSAEMAVGFVDLSRFTSLSNDLDEDALGHLVEDFEDVCTEVVTDGGGRVIKTLGDAVLFVADSAEKGVRIALDLIKRMAARPDIPDVKVGLAHGSVLSRMGDVFGPPVNLAARLTSVARSNRLLVDEATAQRLGPEFERRTLPPRQLRGFGLVSPITVSERRAFRYSS